MKSLFTATVSTLILFSTNLSHAVEPTKFHLTPLKIDENYLTLASVETIEVPTDYSTIYQSDSEVYEAMSEPLPSDLGGLNDQLKMVDVIVDKIINIGAKVWGIIEKGKPVASFTKTRANALPANTLRWDQLQGWQLPLTRVQAIVFKNVYGVEVVRFTYRIVLLYGGNVGGVGKYIGYAAVEPVEIKTAYMYNFNAEASVDSVFNKGTTAQPVAGMLLNITWNVNTVLKTITESHSYSLDATGQIIKNQ